MKAVEEEEVEVRGLRPDNGLLDKIYQHLSKSKRVIFLFDEIDSYTASHAVAQLLYLDSMNHDDIWMVINSPGGYVGDGLAIIDTMDAIESKVNTICIGRAESMGAVIFSCGEKGNRMMFPHATIMLHQPSGGTDGSASDVDIHAKELKRVRGVLYDILNKSTGKQKRTLEKDCNRDYILDCKSSIDYGIADKEIRKLPF